MNEIFQADVSMVEDEGMDMEEGEEVKRDKVDGKEMRKVREYNFCALC